MKTKTFLYTLLIIFLFASCKQSATFLPDLIPVKSNDKWGYVDKEGKYIINVQFSKADFFSCGLALVANDDDMYGYIDDGGNYIVNAQYISALPFSEDKACVVAEGSAPKYIDTKGQLLFELTTAVEAGSFHAGLAKFKDEKGKWGYINKDGSIAINPQFDEVWDFYNELAAVKMDGKDGAEDIWGYINTSGEYVINPQFSEASPFLGDLACVSNGKQYGYINKKGEYVINPQFDRAGLFLNGLAPVRSAKTWGFVDEAGKFTINAQFEDALCFSNDLAPVSLDDKWGFINAEGKFVVNAQFDNASMFIGEIAIVESSDKYGFIDQEGKYIVNPQFDEIKISQANIYAIFGAGCLINKSTICSDKGTPAEDIATDFLTALNKGDTTEAMKYATEDSYSFIRFYGGMAQLGGGAKEITIEGMKCNETSEKAKCEYTEKGEAKTIDLVKQDGKWLVEMKKESPNLETSSLVPIEKVTASSSMAPNGKIKYTPEMATDSDLQTWWSPASPRSDGLNSWLKIDFGEEKEVSGIEILNGSHNKNYPGYGDLYLKNSRLTKAKLFFSDGSSVTISLQDVDRVQKITFSAVTTSYIKLVPIETSKGAKWNDLCISSFNAIGE